MKAKITRWDCTDTHDGSRFTESEDGYWVTIDDHEEVVAEKEELIALLKRQINDLLCRSYYDLNED